MLNFEVSGQKLTLIDEVTVVSDSIKYLTAKFAFSSDWFGLDKVAHFKQGTTVYDIILTDNQILSSDSLNLSAGTWEVYVHGSNNIKRIPSSTIYLTVERSGVLNGQPLPNIPLSAAEQILRIAQSVRDDADAGEFDGVAAGFGIPTAEISMLDIGANPTVEVESSGPDTEKVFNFIFGVPKSSVEPATDIKLGGVIIGDGITINTDGKISVEWVEV